jgi:hypothetical protein
MSINRFMHKALPVTTVIFLSGICFRRQSGQIASVSICQQKIGLNGAKKEAALKAASRSY